MCLHAMMGSYPNIILLFTTKAVFILLFFACLLVIMLREREIIKILKEIRDKK